MQDISDMDREGLPSTKKSVQGNRCCCALIGLLVLITTILPAEYGIDPTGLGHKMGLTVLSQANVTEPKSPEAASSSDNLLSLSAGLCGRPRIRSAPTLRRSPWSRTRALR